MAEEAEHHGGFDELLYLLLFLVAAWAAGKAASRLGAPCLCGELLLGALMGPPVGDVVPFPDAIRTIGEIGLVLMVRGRSAAPPRCQPCFRDLASVTFTPHRLWRLAWRCSRPC